MVLSSATLSFLSIENSRCVFGVHKQTFASGEEMLWQLLDWEIQIYDAVAALGVIDLLCSSLGLEEMVFVALANSQQLPDCHRLEFSM